MSFNTLQKMSLLLFILLYFMISITVTSQGPLIDLKQVELETNKTGNDHPLILTPYINTGKIDEAQKLARVHLKDISDVESYSGFFTVNETCNSNMFFWFFPTERNNTSDPVILWLQGGPGVSSLYGLVEEIGPFYIENGTRLKKREYHWSDKRNLLFIDNPVGTGFSFTRNVPECYSHNVDDIRKNLYNAMVQFYKLFPTLQENDLFLFGESYAGKYIPALAYSIHENNYKSLVKMNLKGLGIGNGLVDPVSMIHYSSLLYNIGLINTNGRDELQILENRIILLIAIERWYDAFEEYQNLLTRILEMTSNVNIHNYLKLKMSIENHTYFYNEDVKHVIHTSNIPFSTTKYDVYNYLLGDFLKSVKPWVEELLEHYRVMFYNGQLDLIVGAVLTQDLIESLNWSGARRFKEEQQFAVTTDDLLAFGTHYGNLCEYRIRNAAHMVPRDQPKGMYYLMDSFINNVTLNISTL